VFYILGDYLFFNSLWYDFLRVAFNGPYSGFLLAIPANLYLQSLLTSDDLICKNKLF
jgi:hypothetical protein